MLPFIKPVLKDNGQPQIPENTLLFPSAPAPTGDVREKILTIATDARFFSGLNTIEANLIFWILFFGVLCLMCLSAVQHHKCVLQLPPIKSLDNCS